MSEEHDDAERSWDDGSGAHARLPPTRPTRRRPPSGRRYRRRRALALLALVVVGFGAWFAIELFQPFAGAGSGIVAVSIPPGVSARQIGDLLASRGVVSSGFFFELRASLAGDGPRLRHGIVQLRHGMSYSAALTALTTAPAVVTIKVTIPEGFTRAQIAVLAKADGLSGDYLVASRPSGALEPRTYGASTAVHTLEGFLFPATYFNYPGAGVTKLVSEQLAAFRQNFGQLSFAKARAAHLTEYDVLIIASMVEREAQVPKDRALVAAVIYNRLRAGMTLGIDATLRYALNDYTHALTASELGRDTPYNSRIHRGLPPTPISNPGLASMIAAADPAPASYLYYVNKPGTCGELAFATSYAQFQADSAAYDAARNAAGGRSPTTCP
jgi:uncharacterized YceG family protein